MSVAMRPFAILAVLIVLTVGQHAWYWTQLPERVATHFGINGQPDAWGSRTSATFLLCLMQIGIPLFLVGVTWLASKLPHSMINIPHREYWLHPDRREETLAWMNHAMAWMAVLTSVFMMTMGHLTFLANKNGAGLNVSFFLAALGTYLVCVFTLAGCGLYRFRLPRSVA